MNPRLTLLGLVAVVVSAVVFLDARPGSAQSPSIAKTRDGLVVVEEVKVGGSCVVVVTRSGSGASDQLAVVPCDD